MSNISDEPGHGSSPAAWTAVVIMLIGVAIGTVFLFFNVVVMVYVGAAVILIGMIVGAIMKAVGLGVGGSRLRGSH